MAVKRHLFCRLDANYVPLVLLKTDGVPLVRLPIHTAPTPTAPTGGGGLPSVGSCSSQPDKKEASFKKRDHYLRVALAITTPLAKQLFPELA